MDKKGAMQKHFGGVKPQKETRIWELGREVIPPSQTHPSTTPRCSKLVSTGKDFSSPLVCLFVDYGFLCFASSHSTIFISNIVIDIIIPPRTIGLHAGDDVQLISETLEFDVSV
ncbi:hypothetical protein ZHAS_00004362 [Anopheles sinensis]|uniref:Uncharacterized protein n=1 Tax=Anopheles sinensis TaxID=74873 RepID=A0A084VGQ4_ANOSI|nr:hypothetical protein ZHAS_00004362 [Anopheles sinensis]